MWATGDVMLEIVDGRKAAKTCPKEISQATGRESGKHLSFCEANWGASTRRYMGDLDEFRDSSINKIVQKAMKLVKGHGASQMMASGSNVDEVDKKRRIRDVSDDESS